MVRIGTSGYSYDDWQPRFYPPGLPKGARFQHYAQRFGCVELNHSFYRQPAAAQSARLAAQAPPGFRFAIKVYGGITHDHAAATRGDFAAFAQGIAPYVEADQLACLLAQFPASFRPTGSTRAFLARLREAWPQWPIAVEFRRRDWLTDQTLADLATLRLACCGVDEPALPGLMPPCAEYTAEPGYLRFHGRNEAKWYHHREAWERYDYTYSLDELREWVPRIKTLSERADTLYVFFNNHYDAQAVTNAQELAEELGLP